MVQLYHEHAVSKNPLGNCIFDLGCAWPKHRQPYILDLMYEVTRNGIEQCEPHTAE
jgi:hypothetical protein